MFKPGELNDEVTLYITSALADAFGFEVESQTADVVIYAKVMAEKGSEFLANGRDNARKAIAVLTHHRTDVAEKDLLEWQGDKYEVVSIVQRERRGETQINAVWTEGR